jgi:hypothetical protein
VLRKPAPQCRSTQDTGDDEDGTDSKDNGPDATGSPRSTTANPDENFDNVNQTNRATTPSETFIYNDREDNLLTANSRDVKKHNEASSDNDDTNGEGESNRRSKKASTQEGYDLVIRMHELLSQVQKQYKSERYRRYLDRDELSEKDIACTLVDFMWVHDDMVQECKKLRTERDSLRHDWDIISGSTPSQLGSRIKAMEKENHRATRDKDEAFNKLSSLRSSTTKEINKLKEDIKNAKHKRETELKNQKSHSDKKYNNMVVDKEKKYNDRVSEISRLTKRISTFESEKKEMIKRHEEAVRTVLETEQREAQRYYLPQIEVLQRKVDGIEATKNAQMQRMVDDYEERMRNLKAYHDHSLADLKEDYNFKLATSDSKLRMAQDDHKHYNQKMEKIHQRNLKAKDDDTEKLKNDHSNEIQVLNESAKGVQRLHLAKIEDIEKKHNEKSNEEKRQSRAVMAKAQREFERHMKELKQENQDLKAALVKRTNQRDTFKHLADRDLTSRFQDLALDVDDVSRVFWEPSRQKSWPVGDRVIRKAENERKIKKYVIQNSIWTVLNKKIFQTPFRILGDRGKPLEQKWVEKFGSGKPLCLLSGNTSI